MGFSGRGLARFCLSLMVAGAIAACAAGPAGAASLYATQFKFSGPAINAVTQFHIGAGGTLEPLNPAVVGANQRPLGIAASPNGQSVYVTNTTSGDIAQYSVSATGALTAKSPFLVDPTGPSDSIGGATAVSTDSSNFYAGGYDDPLSGVFQFDADAGGLLSLLAPPNFDAAGDSNEIAIHPTLPIAYVSDRTGGKIRTFAIAGDGSLSGGASSTAALATGLTVTPNGKYLYASASGSADVHAFSIDSGTGALTDVPGSFTITSGNGQDAIATNSSLYVSALSRGIVQFDIDDSTGALTIKGTAAVATGGNPAGLAMSPDQSSVYVATTNGNTIAQFDVGAGGLLAAKSPATLAVPGEPTNLAVSTTGTGGSEPPPGNVPVPPPAAPTPPPAPTPPAKSEPLTKYFAYKVPGKYVVVEGGNGHGTGGKIIAECKTPPPSTPTLCAGLVEITESPQTGLVISSPYGQPAKAKKKKLLAKAKFSIPKGKKGTIKVKLTAAGKKALKGRKKLNAFMVTTLNNGAEPIKAQYRAQFKLKK